MDSLKDNPPNFLRSEEQLEYYYDAIDILVEAGTAIRDQDCYSIGMMALNLSLMDDCSTSIVEDGMMMTMDGDRGRVSKVNPAVAMQKEAQTSLRFYFKEFQMSPSSRGNAIGGGLNPKSKKDEDGIGSIMVNNKG